MNSRILCTNRPTMTMKFNTWLAELNPPYVLYGVTFTLSKEMLDRSIWQGDPIEQQNIARRLALETVIDEYCAYHELECKYVIESHKSGYPHAHGFIAMNRRLSFSQLQTGYPGRIKFEDFYKDENKNKWLKYCVKSGKTVAAAARQSITVEKKLAPKQYEGSSILGYLIVVNDIYQAEDLPE